MMFQKKCAFTTALFALFLACSAQAAESSLSQKPKDPEKETVSSSLSGSKAVVIEPSSSETADALSSYNRVVFHFNDTLDRVILKPVAELYNKLIPRPLHKGITNFFSNIDSIPTIVNDLLQIKIYYAANDSWRFVINSTVGILGFFDVGSRIGLKPHHEDFGLTLAHWGYKHSNYFEVPFFGPGTIRDVLGWPVDYFFFSIYPHISNPTVRYSLYGLGVVDRRSNFLQYQNVFEQAAVNRYVFMRNAYLQHRNYQIEENEQPNPVSAALKGSKESGSEGEV